MTPRLACGVRSARCKDHAQMGRVHTRGNPGKSRSGNSVRYWSGASPARQPRLALSQACVGIRGGGQRARRDLELRKLPVERKRRRHVCSRERTARRTLSRRHVCAPEVLPRIHPIPRRFCWLHAGNQREPGEEMRDRAYVLPRDSDSHVFKSRFHNLRGFFG